MAINLSIPTATELKPRILVFGVGGAGGNAVNNMIKAELAGVDFVVANTDAQSLSQALTENRVQLGVMLTQGLGAGSRPEIGRQAAEEAMDQIVDWLAGCHMCFITAGMGGGTGTGAAAVIARAARELGILTVAVVTKPFQFEGSHRYAIADRGLQDLQQFVDTLIVIPNQNLFRIANEKTTFADAFGMADNVLHAGVRGVTDLMVMPGLINLDFADVRTVMEEMGKAMMGTGEASGEDRAIQAAEAAINNPLLDDVSLQGARGVLINITGGLDLTLYEVDEAANKIRGEVDPDANIIVGSTFDERLEGIMRVSVVATGIDVEEGDIERPTRRAIPALRAVTPRPEVAPAEPAEMAPEPAPEEVEAGMGEPAYEAEPSAAPQLFDDASEGEAAARYQAFEAAAHAPVEPEAEEAESAIAQGAHYEDRDAPFISPPPIRPESGREPRLVDQQPPQTDRKREKSLFGRLAGVGRGRPEAEAGETPRQGAFAEVRRSLSLTLAGGGEPAAERQPDAQPDEQPPLERHESRENLAPHRSDEDLLEIPAFLRRQAN